MLANVHRPGLVLVLLTLASACSSIDVEGKGDFDRHRMSSLRLSETNPEILIFEAQVSAEYPADSEVGEAKRMEWIEDWMKVRKFCPDGVDVVERRRFTENEPNPYGHDLRYELKCKLEE